MAIAPNTTFTSGQILTAAQMNALPWGIVAFGSKTTGNTYTTEATQVTTNAFTAVANRYYRITYHEPVLYSTTGGVTYMRIKNGATQLQNTYVTTSPAYEAFGHTYVVTTFSAGSVTITGTIAAVVGSPGTAVRGATQPAIITVEDIGPA
jgi:hypothetical protein